MGKLIKRQIGARESGWVGLNVASAVSTNVVGCDSMESFIRCFQSDITKIKSGNNTKVEMSYLVIQTTEKVEIWKLDCQGYKKRILFEITTV